MLQQWGFKRMETDPIIPERNRVSNWLAGEPTFLLGSCII